MPLVAAAAAWREPELDPGAPPAGTPLNGLAYQYGGSLIGVQWANGDPEAFTQLGLSSDSGTFPTEVFASAAPGATSYETGTTIVGQWWLRHHINGQSTAWVIVSSEE